MKVPIRQLADALADWIEGVILPSITSPKGVLVKGAMNTIAKVIRVRPELISTMVKKYWPIAEDLKLIDATGIDSELARTAIDAYFEVAETFDLAGISDATRFLTYNVSRQEAAELTKRLLAAEGAAAVLTAH